MTEQERELASLVDYADAIQHEETFEALKARNGAGTPGVPATRSVPPVPPVPAVPEETPVPTMALADYLEQVLAFMCRYVAFPSEHEPVTVALWVAHAWFVDHFETSPILAVTSPEMRSGKTRTLDCIELLVPRPFRVVTPSEAVVYTVLSQQPRPTFMLDEADAIFGTRSSERYEGVRAILNSGNRKGTPVLRVRLEGHNRAVEAFDVFGPKAIAGIGKLPDTVSDRSIPIRLKRRAPHEWVAKFRSRAATAEANPFRRPPNVSLPPPAEVLIPEELHDRAADGWEALLTMADTAGADWPARARAAAVALSSHEEQTVSHGARLLTDVRAVFGDLKTVQTTDLLIALHNMSPWSEWNGKPLTSTGLAKLLEPYGIYPAQRRVDGRVQRGYWRVDFEDAWLRYAAPPGTPGTAGTPVTWDDPEDIDLSLFGQEEDQ